MLDDVIDRRFTLLVTTWWRHWLKLDDVSARRCDPRWLRFGRRRWPACPWVRLNPDPSDDLTRWPQPWLTTVSTPVDWPWLFSADLDLLFDLDGEIIRCGSSSLTELSAFFPVRWHWTCSIYVSTRSSDLQLARFDLEICSNLFRPFVLVACVPRKWFTCIVRIFACPSYSKEKSENFWFQIYDQCLRKAEFSHRFVQILVDEYDV